MMYAVWIGDHYPNLPQPLPIKSSRGTIFINIFRHGTHCISSGERYPGTDDISEKLWDDLRKGMSRGGIMERRRYILNFSWLSCWLKWKQVEQITHLERSCLTMCWHWILASMIILMYQCLFPRDFLMAGSLGISKWFRHDPYLLFLLDLFIGMQTNHYVQHTIAFPSGISGPDVRTSPLLGCMKWD